MPKAMKNLQKPNKIEINVVADKIACVQGCSSCAGIGEEDKHCVACTEEATAAIKAFLKFRKSK